MNPLLLAGVLALVSAALGVVLGTALLSVIWRATGTRLDLLPPQPRAWLLVFVRLLPGACAIVCAALVVTAFARFEPPGAREVPGGVLVVLAASGAALFGVGVRRGLRAWLDTGRLVNGWSEGGRQTTPAALPVVEIDTVFPVVAVVGIWRPRLFIARRVLRTCTAGEVEAMIAHESAHVSRRDNLTRLLFLCCPTLRRGSEAAAVEHAWTRASEEASDDRARQLATSPLLLASALTKVARLALGVHAPLLHASAILSGDSVESRVRRLLQAPPEPHGRGRILLLLIPATAGLLGAALTTSAQRGLHETVELAVRYLP